MSASLPRSTPSAQGVAAAGVERFLDAVAADDLELHSLMVLRHGAVVAEGWWEPYAADGLQLLYSLSKSFTATAVGLAQAEGLLSVHDRVLDLLPDAALAQPDEHLAALRVRHALAMATGHHEDTLARVDRRDPVRASRIQRRPRWGADWPTVPTWQRVSCSQTSIRSPARIRAGSWTQAPSAVAPGVVASVVGAEGAVMAARPLGVPPLGVGTVGGGGVSDAPRIVRRCGRDVSGRLTGRAFAPAGL